MSAVCVLEWGAVFPVFGAQLCQHPVRLRARASSYPSTLYQAVRRAQAHYEYTFRLGGYLDFPLLPFGLSSPVSD